MLEKHIYSAKKFQQFGLYLATVAGMIYAGYGHLNFVARGIENLQIKHIMQAWPVLFLLISVPVLLISAFVSLDKRQQAAKVAFFGALLGWGYFVPTICTAFLWVSILVFTSPVGFLQFFVPSILLLVTTIYSRRVQRQGSDGLGEE